MRRLVPIWGLILLAIPGCGAVGDTHGTTRLQVEKSGAQVTTCGAREGFEFKLHKVGCDIANTLIVMLDGRALHQSVILEAEGKRRGEWICTSPTRSLVDHLHCRHGAQSFTVTRAPG
jgi:hypothetical protein